MYNNTQPYFWKNLLALFKGDDFLTEEQLKKNIAKNITFLRKSKGMTQAELAESLSYSDKSVSKWERGDGIPDVIVLNKIAELFGVKLDDLICDEVKIAPPRKLPYLTTRIMVPLLTIGLVFLVASLIFFVLKILPFELPMAWIIFVYALPVSCIPLVVFACLWWGYLCRALCVSALVWTSVLALCLSFKNVDMNSAFITAAILQVLIILWFTFRYVLKRRKEKDENMQKNKETESRL